MPVESSIPDDDADFDRWLQQSDRLPVSDCPDAFRTEVWRRIAREEQTVVSSGSAAWFQALTEAIVQPRWAFAAVLFCVGLGGTLGAHLPDSWDLGRGVDSRGAHEYTRSINPLTPPMHE